MADERTDHQPWPLRALLLLGVGALFGLAFALLVTARRGEFWNWTDDPVRLSLATGVAIGGLVFAFTLERKRWPWSVAFAALAGAVLALVQYWNGQPDGAGADQAWRFLAGLLAVAIAAPLFQTMRDEGRRRLPYPVVHAHSWTNVVLWFAAWAFVLVTWLLALLLAELFQLIGIDLLRDALNQSWFNWVLIGSALGAAVGLLRDRDRVLGLLQRVVTTVLSFLAPVLALGLLVFVLALPFTGLAPLWDQTRATTPILLSCVIGAIILANAVIGNAPEEEAHAPPLRWSAMVLGAVMLPLVAVAAVSTGLRIDQHGLTPARLWAAVAIAIAAAYAALYLLALVLGRRRWSERLRPYNIYLAIGVCALALLLATPLVSFGAISTRDQLARLESGRVEPAEFDWRALRFDFGPSGRRALERVAAQSANPEVRRLARRALDATHRYALMPANSPMRPVRRDEIQLRSPTGAVPESLIEAVERESQQIALCTGGGDCLVFWRPDEQAAIVVHDQCRLLRRGTYSQPSEDRCRIDLEVLVEQDGTWRETDHVARPSVMSPREEQRSLAAEGDAIMRGDVTIREVRRRQVFIGDQPVGGIFE